MTSFSQELNVADIVPRMFACLIDMVIVAAIFLGTTYLLSSMSSELYGNVDYTSPVLGALKSKREITPLLLYVFLLFIEMWIYFVPLETSKWQASLGKKICGLKVVNGDGKPLTYFQASMRCLVKFLTFGAPVWWWTTGSLLLIVSNSRHKALHDFVAGTLVAENFSGYYHPKDVEAAKRKGKSTFYNPKM